MILRGIFIPSLDKSVLLPLEQIFPSYEVILLYWVHEALVYPRDSMIEFKLDSGNVL